MGRKFKRTDIGFLERKGWKIWRSQLDIDCYFSEEKEAKMFKNFWKKYDRQDNPKIILSEASRFEVLDDIRRYTKEHKNLQVYTCLESIDGETGFSYDWDDDNKVKNAIDLRDIEIYDKFIETLKESLKEEVGNYLGDVHKFISHLEFNVVITDFKEFEVTASILGVKLDLNSEFGPYGLFESAARLNSFNPYNDLGIEMKDEDILKSFGLNGLRIPNFDEFVTYITSLVKWEFLKFFHFEEGKIVKEAAKAKWNDVKQTIKHYVDKMNTRHKREEAESLENKRLGEIFLSNWSQERVNKEITIENFDSSIFGEPGKIVTLRNVSFIKGTPVVAILELKDHWQKFEVYTENKDLLAQYEANVKARMEEVRREREEKEAWAHILDNWEPF